PDLASFAAASGLETHGIRISHSTCFAIFDVPNPPPSTVPPQVMTLKTGCNALDAGVVLPNINDATFFGAAPDLGAYEYGQPAPTFGPRAVAAAIGDIVIYASDIPVSARHGSWTTQASSSSPSG